MRSSDEQHNRRRFLEKVAIAGAGAIAASTILPEIVKGLPDEKKKVLTRVTNADHEELEKTGGSVLIKNTDEGDVLIVRSTDKEYTAMSNICPHKECKVKVRKKKLIQCPCHRSAYDLDGTYRQGPAKKSLRAFKVEIKGGIITVYTG